MTIKESIKFIISSNIEYEFRTTVYPKYISKENVINIAKQLKEFGVKEYYLQQYQDIVNQCKPYTQEELQEIVDECNKYICTKLKGVV